jgi:hypothetical protein
MADEPLNPVLEHLRAIRTDIAAVREDVRELKARVSNLEIVAGVIVTSNTNVQHAVDRQGDRIERIERRLGLVDPSIAPA